jgi:UDP-GlcNAc:undecaprenyl-phosphate/decaprenyl-phosphate GlcNAc-1-phosphate transferase
VSRLVPYLTVGGVAAVATLVLTPIVRRLSVRFGAVVPPDERRVHDRPTPVGGGAAMLLGLLIAVLVASRIPEFKPVFRGSAPLGVVLAGGIIFMVGLIDDVREMSAPAKAAGQVLAGCILYFLGVSMSFFRVPFADIISLSPDMAPSSSTATSWRSRASSTTRTPLP